MAVTRLVPPYPEPHRTRSSLGRRFWRGWHSWIHVLFQKSYTMKMGEIHTPALSFYIANEPTLVARVLVDEAARFPKHRFLQQVLDPLIGNSLFSSNGEDWRRQRAMVDPAFGQAGLARVHPLMQGAVDALVARLSALDLSKPVRIDPLTTHFAADVIFRTLFGRTLDADAARRIHDAFQRYQRAAQSASMLRLYRLPTLGFERRARRAAAAIHAEFADLVAARHAAFQPDAPPADILDALLAARDPETGAPFDLDALMGQVSTLFLAGHETAASATAWALWLLAADPDSQGRVRAEADLLWRHGPPGHSDLKSLPATREVFRETLRLYPPVSFLLREVTCPTRMRDKTMQTGAMLVVSPWLIQRNEQHWPDAHAFVPGRHSDPAARAACRDAWLPFGKGPRVCVGAGFAQQEAVLLLAELVRRFHLRPVPGRTPEPISRLTLRARRGIWLALTPVADR